MSKLIAVAMLVATLCLGSVAHADPASVSRISQLGGPCLASAVSGNQAYIGMGPRLVILDISVPSNPTVLGMSAPLPESIRGIAISGSYAYIADGLAGLHIIDVSNPASPTTAGSLDFDGQSEGIAVSGNYAYLANGVLGLRIVDIFHVWAPSLVSTFATADVAHGVTVSGNYAYVAEDTAGLQIINVSNPASPSLAGTCDTIIAQGVAVSGSYAYVADGGNGLQIINVSNPASPTLTSNYNTSGNARAVAISNSTAYVADSEAGLEVIDVTNPIFATRLGGYDTAGISIGVCVGGSCAYVADDYAGLQIVDVSTPTAPTRVGGYNTGGYAYGIELAGNRAYIASELNGVQILDVTNPAAPVRLGAFDTPGEAQDVAVSGDYAYVADYYNGLQIVNISNPASPSIVGTYNTPGRAMSVVVDGTYAYVADYESGLQIINITNPASPTLTGSYDTAGYAYGVAVSGNYACIADGSLWFRVVNITNKAAPTLAGECTMYGTTVDITVSGSYAYVASGDAGLQIVNISNPAWPTRTSQCDTAGNAMGVAYADNKAYIADLYNGVRVIDVTNRMFPASLGGGSIGGYVYKIAVLGNNVFTPACDHGLAIGRVSYQPSITMVTPDHGPNNGSTSVSIAGAFFAPGATVQLIRYGAVLCTGTGVTVVSPETITCAFNLSGIAPGLCDVKVTNTDGLYAWKGGGFNITLPAPIITSISPALGRNNGSVYISNLAGSYFQSGATARLRKDGETDIVATGVTVVSATRITCTFDLAGRTTGLWSVQVTNTDGQSGYLVNGFTVAESEPPVISSVTVEPSIVGPNDSIYVDAVVTDNIGVASVWANGGWLTRGTGDHWTGYVPGYADPGVYPVTVIAADDAGNEGFDGSAMATVVPAVFILNRDIQDDLSTWLMGNYVFTIFGKVTRLDANAFDIDDGSAFPVRVNATNHGLVNDDFAFVRGIWSKTAIPPTLNSRLPYITKVEVPE